MERVIIMTTTSPLIDSKSTTMLKQDDLNLLVIDIEHMLRIPFSQSTFLQYSKSLNAVQRADIIKALKLDLSKKWSDLLFIKKMSIALKKINSDTAMMKQVLMVINKTIIQPEPTLDDYEQQLEPLIQAYSYWNVYWSIYYHSDRPTNEAKVTGLLERLNQQTIKVSNQKEVKLTSDIDSTNEPLAHQPNQSKLDKKMALLEAKASKETQLRIQAEQEIAKLEKQNRLFKIEIDKQQQASEQLKQKFNESLQQLEKQDHLNESILRKKREEEERWLQERSSLLLQIRQLSEESKKQASTIEQLASQLEEARKQVLSLTQTQNQLQKQKENSRLEHERTEKLIYALQYRLHKRIERTNNSLLHLNNEERQTNYEATTNKLNFIKQTIELIEHTQGYLDIDVKAKQAALEANIRKSNEPLAEQTAPAAEELGYYGTFYRRDHGGYVELESGETFNITESLVQQLELQHEAEVLCTPTQTNGKVHYAIQIVFQGDDNYSPITQYDGYVHYDAEGKWFCVDLNDETRKFPIHFKDIDIQKPSHGDPCTFNVANDGYIARLTKLYRLLPGETFESTFTTKKAEKAKAATATTVKEKREPYLTGCTITIIGGQRKWFESVVKETGAELVHNGGEKPERIASDLARSQALFMILTSTSHRATWEGVEIAKANNIPHFTIQGSKSNLRSLLWENQQIIRETNRNS